MGNVPASAIGRQLYVLGATRPDPGRSPEAQRSVRDDPKETARRFRLVAQRSRSSPRTEIPGSDFPVIIKKTYFMFFFILLIPLICSII